MAVLGIRREDKNRWERRAPLTPAQVEQLVHRHGIGVAVQRSAHRVFADAAYAAAGATLSDDLAGVPVILGVKEVPVQVLRRRRTYVCFAHVVKGQAKNMPMLRRFVEQECTLIDYERIVDHAGKRLIGFGRYAGYAGMIDALWALGERLTLEGIESPFSGLLPAHAYVGVEEAAAVLRDEVGPEIAAGLPPALAPLVVGFTGGGKVATGAQELWDHLPSQEIAPGELGRAVAAGLSDKVLYKVVFRRPDRVDFGRYLPYLTMLVNGIFWRRGDPKLATVADLQALYSGPGTPRLRVLADLSCDVRGSIEATVRTTTPGDPIYVFDPFTGEAVSGVAGRGPVVLAVDNLPAELPRDASADFGSELLAFLPELAAADFSLPYDELALPPSLHAAVITHGGRLAPPYAYLEEALARHAA